MVTAAGRGGRQEAVRDKSVASAARESPRAVRDNSNGLLVGGKKLDVPNALFAGSALRRTEELCGAQKTDLGASPVALGQKTHPLLFAASSVEQELGGPLRRVEALGFDARKGRSQPRVFGGPAGRLRIDCRWNVAGGLWKRPSSSDSLAMRPARGGRPTRAFRRGGVRSRRRCLSVRGDRNRCAIRCRQDARSIPGVQENGCDDDQDQRGGESDSGRRKVSFRGSRGDFLAGDGLGPTLCPQRGWGVGCGRLAIVFWSRSPG
jgi:hypothetical protein